MSKAAELAKFIADGTLGLGGEEDKKLVFDGNAQDFHIGLDDSSDSLTIGLGSTLGTTSHMVIDANGHITKPLQPAFLSKISSTQTNIPVYTETTINFDTEIFDQNNDYNNSTYIFTAPVTGRYQLQAHLYFREVNKDYAYAYMLLKTSNRNHAIETDPGIFDEDAAFSMTLAQLCDMDANDTAFVTVQFPNLGSAQADIHSYSEFSGFLVC